MTVFARDYLGSQTRERLPLVVRVALDLVTLAVRDGGFLASDAPIVNDARSVCPGLVETLTVEERGRLAVRNDWLDLPALCAASRRFSSGQEAKARKRWNP